MIVWFTLARFPIVRRFDGRSRDNRVTTLKSVIIATGFLESCILSDKISGLCASSPGEKKERSAPLREIAWPDFGPHNLLLPEGV